MKKSVNFLCGLVCILGFFACKKNNVTANYSLTGKWNVVKDSLNSSFINKTTINYYTGVSGDYYDFRTDNKLYIKEGNTLDTLSYTINSNTSVVISTFGIIANGVPTDCTVKLTANSAFIGTNALATPAGVIWRRVYLSR